MNVSAYSKEGIACLILKDQILRLLKFQKTENMENSL